MSEADLEHPEVRAMVNRANLGLVAGMEGAAAAIDYWHLCEDGCDVDERGRCRVCGSTWEQRDAVTDDPA